MCVKSNNPLVIACRRRTGADFWSSACKHHCLSRSCSDTDVGLVQHSVLDTVILQDTISLTTTAAKSRIQCEMFTNERRRKKL